LSDFRPAPKASCHTPKIPILRRKQTRRPLPQFFSSLLGPYNIGPTDRVCSPAMIFAAKSFQRIWPPVMIGVLFVLEARAVKCQNRTLILALERGQRLKLQAAFRRYVVLLSHYIAAGMGVYFLGGGPEHFLIPLYFLR
jgi:hypothetical protein